MKFWWSTGQLVGKRFVTKTFLTPAGQVGTMGQMGY